MTRRSTTWSGASKVGDYYTIESYGFTIYGHITKHQGRKDSGFFWADGYSIHCSDGEPGVVCIVDIHRTISEEEFNAARSRGWTEVPS